MESKTISIFLDFLKQKYNIFFLLLVFYILQFEINFGYFHLTFDYFFMDNPLVNFLLTIIQPTQLKLIEIWLKFNIVFIGSYIFYYSYIEKPKDLRSLLIIKRNFQIYPLVYLYFLFALLFYYISITINYTTYEFKNEINFLQSFAIVSTVLHFLLIYSIINRINNRWTIITERERKIWETGKFTKNSFLAAVPYGFEDYDNWQKAKSLNLTHFYELQFYEEMQKNNFPTINDYLDAKGFNIDSFEEWEQKKNELIKSKTNYNFRTLKNLFNFKYYFSFTLKSKFNLFFIPFLIITYIEYNLFLNSFFTGENYVTKLTYFYFINRWLILYVLLLICYLLYFLKIQPPKTVLEATIVKVNSFIFCLVFLVFNCFRIEFLYLGPPQYFIDLESRILQNAMAPSFGYGVLIFILLLPAIYFSFFTLNSITISQYYEYLNGNFISYGNYKEFKLNGVLSNQDYVYELKMQPYLKTATN